MFTKKITKEDLLINIHHVGGIGHCGPAELLSRLRHVQWTIYDADAESLNSSNLRQGVPYKLINKCVGGSTPKTTFNIMKATSASSIYPSEKTADNFTFYNSDASMHIWGKHAAVTRTVKIQTETLDEIKKNNKEFSIDFLSIDAQGADLEIIQGASRQLDLVMGIICEVEFRPIYENQSLFGDINKYLRKHNFGLYQIYNHQNWHIAPYPFELQGRGFDIVGEALFLKNIEKFIEGSKKNKKKRVTQLIKLAACSLAFDQLDTTIYILDLLKKEALVDLQELALKTDIFYVKLLSDIFNAAEEIKAEADLPDDGDYVSCKRISKDLLEALTTPEGLSRKIEKQKEGVYLSYISQIYHTYGLTQLANIHEQRFLWTILSRQPQFQAKFTMFPEKIRDIARLNPVYW